MLQEQAKTTANDEEDTEEQVEIENQVNQPPQYVITFDKMFWEKIYDLESELTGELMKIDFLKEKSVDAVYNPLDYASDIHINYLKKYLKRAPAVLFLGMNPGLYGMCQTAVPFGHVPSVKNWMKLSGKIEKPAHEVSAKPIDGLSCQREEQSGKRFWGLIEELCGEPENFFRHCFVHNICPLAFLNKNGRNITPVELKGEIKSTLNAVCIKYLAKSITTFNPKIIVSIGSYANDRIKELKKKNLISESIECKLLAHPSPRALNNSDWVEKARKWMSDNDMLKYFKED